jgi:hypothetical protein
VVTFLARVSKPDLVYGRNIFQAKDPVAMTIAVLDIVHGRTTAAEAIRRFQ